jgi:hypothetical protein
MKQEVSVDFAKIEWTKIDREKAEFIYNEALARLDSVHKNNDGITNKALGMLTLAVPVLAALTGFFAVQWGNLSVPLFAASICSGVFLFAILAALLLVLFPRGVTAGQGEPATYFSNDYYFQNMENIYKGNIQSLQKQIDEDRSVLYLRGNIFRIAILLFAAFPVVTALAAAISLLALGL